MRKKRIHETGGGPAPPELTPIEEAVWTILGETPAFIGVQPHVSDTKISMKRSRLTMIGMPKFATRVLLVRQAV